MTDTRDYRIGLDIGTNSIGWAIIELEYNGEQYDKKGLIDAGVRMFDKAEIPKTGASLAEPRRLARSTRRRLNRRADRKKSIRRLIVEQDILNEAELQVLYQEKELLDIWTIRVEALDRRLSRTEWARLLIQLAQRRGYRSARKSEENDKETGVVLQNIRENKKLIDGYRTVGEMWVKDPRFQGRRHNSRSEYVFNVTREMLEEEIRTLFHTQRELGLSFASKEMEESYLSIWGKQLPFASGKDILKRVGFCTLEEQERRFPKATFTFQYFMVLDKLNRLRIKPSMRPLTEEERKSTLHYLFDRDDLSKKKTPPKVMYKEIRKQLNLAATETFNELTYDPNESMTKNENVLFVNLDAYYRIKQQCDLHNERYGPRDYDALGYALTVYKTDKDIRQYLRNKTNLANRIYSEELISNLLSQSYATFGHISKKALLAILPSMEKGDTFKVAADKMGYDTTGLQLVKKELLLPVIPNDITNPVVMRALTQARKVVNAIIKRLGEQPLSIHIELARDLLKGHDERRKISNEYKQNHKRNAGAYTILNENGIINPRGYDIVRYKLWQEQKQKCAYSGKVIPSETFFGELKKERGQGAPTLDVDHIIPYSKCFNDSYSNKVLVYSDENRKKGNHLPFDYLKESPSRWEEFETYVLTNEFPRAKRERLLKKQFSEDEESVMKERHLNDTRYASRYFKQFVEKSLQFKKSKNQFHKKRVETVAGRVTAHFRQRWGFEKHREGTHLHHALDAIVVACTDAAMIQALSLYHKQKEEGKKGYIKRFPLPWITFRDDVLNKLSESAIPEQIYSALVSGTTLPSYMLVSRMPRRSVTGPVHKETISKDGGVDEKGKTLIVKKVQLQDIKFNKNGDFLMYMEETDPATYKAIKERYLSFNKDAKKAFQDPLYKPSKKGKPNQIKSVKVIVEKKAHVRKVNGGVAENGDLIRIDFFQKEGKFFMVPLYTYDTIQSDLPNRYVVSGKGYQLWPQLTNEHKFIQSVHPYELLRVVKRSGDDRFLYLASINISNNVLKFIEPNFPHNDYIEISLGTIKHMEKYDVNVLGQVSLKATGPRLGFNNMKAQKNKVKG
ncbi:type II CRISPR RNA-guided endonuclease Cas9 [Halalkalibacter okhensis]|uniref:type II CRISPR RNA-guided endonuclease Cas9 n=1 Tax=Halalkalibacter okhensis TaxID=333138 RepID=UPI00068E2231|nr:type II CRISPR RNA-guided endonuclease Cas9 [Halalkalibacter okhensis]